MPNVSRENWDNEYYRNVTEEDVRDAKLKEFKEREQKLVQEIENLRIRGDSHSADRADLLRDYLDTERREFEHISAFYAKIKEGGSDTNN